MAEKEEKKKKRQLKIMNDTSPRTCLKYLDNQNPKILQLQFILINFIHKLQDIEQKITDYEIPDAL